MVLKQKPRIDVVGVVVPLLVLAVTLPVAVSPFFGVAAFNRGVIAMQASATFEYVLIVTSP